MNQRWMTFALVNAFALSGILAGVMLGVEFYDPATLLRGILHPEAAANLPLLGWRIQRVLGAFLVGSCLAIAGVLYQGAFRNPLAEPFLLGSAAGASLGAAFAILFPISIYASLTLPVLAFLGAWGATLLVLTISRVARIEDAAGMLLVGIALSSLIGAIRSMATLVLSDESVSLRAMMSWTLGGLQTPTGSTLLAFAALVVICLLASLKLARGLDILGFGEATASTMGLPVSRFLTITLTVAAFATGLGVAWGGVLGFVGLIVPHAIRWWVGERHGPLLFHSAIAGGGLLALLDGVSRSVLPPSEIPLGLITAIIGAPFFLLLLVRRYK